MTCAHCSVASSPRIADSLEDAEVEALLDRAIAAGAGAVQLTGGEPMLREDLLLRLMKKCCAAGVGTAMTSNGFWGKVEGDADRRVRAFKEAGLSLLTISYDVFHSPFLSEHAVRHIAAACTRHALPMNLNVTRGEDDSALECMAAIARDYPAIRLRVYDVQPVGRAMQFDPSSLRSNTSGFCEACRRPAICDDGRVTACNGPSYFHKPGSPLVIADAGEDFTAAFEKHASDPYLEGVRVLGPARMLQEALQLLPPETLSAKDRYAGICDVCTHLSSTPEAVATLRAHLATPSLQAEMAARRRLVRAKRKVWGNFRFLNEVELPMLLFRATDPYGEGWESTARQLLGRADVDWARLIRTIKACGLARPFATLLDHPLLQKWSPSFFGIELREQAGRDAMRQLLARRALRRIAATIESVGARAILLKTPGAAVFARPEDPVPAPGDLDLLVLEGAAERIHAELKKQGLRQWPGHPKGPTPHHLPVLDAWGIPLEIHTRVAPAWLGLPEQAMTAEPVNLDGPIFRMRPEPHFLHVLAHAGCHDFQRGLKTAWSARRILQSSPSFDWQRLARLVDEFRGARGFWAVCGHLSGGPGLAIPASFLAGKPKDRIQKRVDRLVRLHFDEAADCDEPEPFLSPALVLLTQTRIPTPSAGVESARLFLKEMGWRLRMGRNTVREGATFRELGTHHLHQLKRSYRAIVAG
jgi:hypothetical protein